MKIGIAITTVPSRKKILQKAMRNHKRYQPQGSIIYIHEDTSSIGIALSKNNCIAYLMEQGCTHLFLFDDDCWPIKENWYGIFINSELNFAALTFSNYADGTPNGNKLKYTDGGIDYFSNPCGIMLYYRREAIEAVGGMDSNYNKWGDEHVGHHIRLANYYKCHPFAAPSGAMNYFYSLDQQRQAESTFTTKPKKGELHMWAYNHDKSTSEWKPYKRSHFALGAYYNSQPDPQRRKIWQADTANVKIWAESAIKIGLQPVVFTDCLSDMPGVIFIKSKVPGNECPNNYRFRAFYDFIFRHNHYIDEVYCTDITDVEFFSRIPMKPNTVYIGSEPQVNRAFLQKQNRRNRVFQIPNPMLNCGIIAGKCQAVEDFLTAIVDITDEEKDNFPVDMFSVNYVAKRFDYETGYPIHSVFKKYETNSKTHIRHK